MEVPYLSYFFKKHRGDYYALLQRIRDHGEWEPWLEFFLRGIAVVGREATEKARRIVSIREEHRARIQAELGRAAPNALTLLERLYEKPIVSVNDVVEITGAAFATANRIVDALSGLGSLVETTGHSRNRVFAYDSYLAMFVDDQTEAPTPT